MFWEDYDMHLSPTTERLLFIFEIDAASLLSGLNVLVLCDWQPHLNGGINTSFNT
jgi:hypothetical protein